MVFPRRSPMSHAHDFFRKLDSKLYCNFHPLLIFVFDFLFGHAKEPEVFTASVLLETFGLFKLRILCNTVTSQPQFLLAQLHRSRRKIHCLENSLRLLRAAKPTSSQYKQHNPELAQSKRLAGYHSLHMLI